MHQKRLKCSKKYIRGTGLRWGRETSRWRSVRRQWDGKFSSTKNAKKVRGLRFATDESSQRIEWRSLLYYGRRGSGIEGGDDRKISLPPVGKCTLALELFGTESERAGADAAKDKGVRGLEDKDDEWVNGLTQKVRKKLAIGDINLRTTLRVFRRLKLKVARWNSTMTCWAIEQRRFRRDQVESYGT